MFLFFLFFVLLGMQYPGYFCDELVTVFARRDNRPVPFCCNLLAGAGDVNELIGLRGIPPFSPPRSG